RSRPTAAARGRAVIRRERPAFVRRRREYAMTIRKLIVALVGTAALAGLALQADARVDVYVDVAPPPVRYEVVPAARAGFVWAPGHWAWRGHPHVWIAGHWVRH